ncbi:MULTISPECIES: GNAT family N-acetyltransferase [unclassified Actinoplanes]|uniref:GNAT family N-acetyltransferase n=1 Tax=unclassified Actinoplanes TaxID=2626549 RepID=UPI0012FAC7C9|nr:MULTISPECIES: GNAT family N-acetyltransferase [unclassified Actinoplanes]
MLLVDVDTAIETDWHGYEGHEDLVRVEDPPVEAWEALAGAGLLPKPEWLTWVADCQSSEDEFLGRMPRKERQSIAAARRRAAADGVRLRLGDLDSTYLDAFLPLYEARTAEKRHGWSVVSDIRGDLLADAADYFVVSAWRGDEFVGGCINLAPSEGAMRIRFSAVDQSGRYASLARALYLEAIREARVRGYRSVSLGTDPNLYGHVVEPGLLRFKSRLGFEPKPSHQVTGKPASDCADLVLGFAALMDPTIMFSYRTNAVSSTASELQAEIYSYSADVAVDQHTAALSFPVRRHVVDRRPTACATGNTAPR